MHKALCFLFFYVFTFINCPAQFYEVTHNSGPKVIAWNTVTVSVESGVGYGGECSNQGYKMGANATNGATFDFAAAVDHIRLQVFGGNDGEEITAYLNGAKYTIKNQELSPYKGLCAGASYSVNGVKNGNFAILTGGPIGGWTENGTIDILKQEITSFRVKHANAQSGGLYVKVFFMADTFPYIDPTFIKSNLCQGDAFPLPFKVTKPHNLGNVFTAQLSDDKGDFTNPVDIGKITATTALIPIPCTIPGNTPVGTGYRIRIIASSPSRIGPDNGFDITIGPGQSVPSVSTNSPVCEGDPLKLDATSSTPGVTYTWTGPGLPTPSNAQNTVINNTTTAMTGTYTVTAKIMGCVSQNSINAVVSIAPKTPAVSSNSPVCELGTLKLFANTAGSQLSYEWKGPGSITAKVPNPEFYNISLAYGGTYTVTAKIGSCTSPSASVNVVVIPAPPKPSASATSPVCEGGTLNLSSTEVAGCTYAWAGPNGFKSAAKDITINNVPAGASGKYVITVTSTCSNFDTIDVKVNPLPDSPKISSNSPVCDGYQLMLYADGVPGTVYTWRGPNGYSSALQNPAHFVSFTDSGWYYLRTSLAGCAGPEVGTYVNVKFTPPPPSAYFNDPVNEFDTLQLHGRDMYPGSTYFWKGPDSFYSTDLHPKIPDITTDQSGTYLFCTSYDGCVSSARLLINVVAATEWKFILYPNPNYGSFTVEGNLRYNQELPIQIYNELGMIVYRDFATSAKKKVKKGFTVGPTLASGVYYFVIRADGVNRVIPFTLLH